MSLSCEELVDEIQALTGRVGDTKLIDDTFCTRRLNECQVYMVDHCPQLIELEFKNTSSIDFSEDKISYAITDITAGDTTDEAPAHIFRVGYVDGADSIWLDFQPSDEFDSALIDPTSSDHSSSKPTRWTRRGNYIEVAPRPSSSYENAMRVDGCRYAMEFTTNDSSASEIPNCDELLRCWGVSKAFGAMGKEEKSALWMAKFNDAFTDFQDKHGRMEAWDGDTIFDYPEGNY